MSAALNLFVAAWLVIGAIRHHREKEYGHAYVHVALSAANFTAFVFLICSR